MARRKRDGGDCYSAAARLVTFGFLEDALVCHGETTPVVGRLRGETFGHAWVETPSDVVIDQSNGLDVRMPREHYYALGGIDGDAVRRYTADQARDEMLRTGHYGPWE